MNFNIRNKKVLFTLKAIVSITLLTIIIANIDWKEVTGILKNGSYILLAAALSLNIIERAQLTYKWNLLIRARGVNISFIKLFLINAIGGFWGMFLPSSLGTDVVRGYYLSKSNSEKSISISSVFIDRILGMLSLLLLGIIALLMAGDLIKGINIGLYIIVLFLGLILFLYFFQKETTAGFVRKYLGKIKYKKIGEIGIKLHDSLLEYKKYPKTLWFSFAVTLLVQITRVATYYIIALAFNISVPIVFFFLFIPIIMIVIMIPISVGGFGLSEGTFIAFFTLAGMSANDAVIISFSNSIINTLVTLAGGAAFLFFKSDAESLNSHVKPISVFNNNSSSKKR